MTTQPRTVPPTTWALNEVLRVCVVLDESHCAAAGRSVTQTVADAVAGGATMIQVRAKNADDREFYSLIAHVCAVVDGQVPVVINDRVDLFLAARMDTMAVAGVHVGQRDLPVSVVRRLVGQHALIGVSASRKEEIRSASHDWAAVSYIGLGALHATGTKADAPAPLGLEAVAQRIELATVPTVVIGGITVADVPAVRAVGAAGVAVSSAVCGARDAVAAAAQFRSAWDGTPVGVGKQEGHTTTAGGSQ